MAASPPVRRDLTNGLAVKSLNAHATCDANGERRLRDVRRELHAALIDAYAEGMSLAVLARASGYSRERVRQIVKTDAWNQEPI